MREKGQIEMAKTLETPVFSRGIEILTEKLKFVWCLLLVAIPIAIAYAGTDINTIKAIVLATGLPLIIILFIIYHGFLREMVRDFGSKSKEEIIKMGKPEE